MISKKTLKNFSVFSFAFFSMLFYKPLFSAEIILKGQFYGNNLYVENPSFGNGFCVKKVFVNNIETEDQLQSNAFEIDFSRLSLKIGDSVTVVIKHHDACKPLVINPQVLKKTETVTWAYAKVDKTGKLVWSLTGEIPEDVFIIEQYRWNKWVKCSEISTLDTTSKNAYAYEFVPHFGINQFRIIRNDINGNPVYSKTIKYTSRTPEILLESNKTSLNLVFTAETLFEIFDAKGNFITEGFGKEVDVADLPKGKYWVNYDNKSESFSKK